MKPGTIEHKIIRNSLILVMFEQDKMPIKNVAEETLVSLSTARRIIN